MNPDLISKPDLIPKVLFESGDSVTLTIGLLLNGLLVELGGQLLAGTLAQRLLNELAGLAALAAGEALGLHGCLALGRYSDFDGFHPAAQC